MKYTLKQLKDDSHDTTDTKLYEPQHTNRKMRAIH